LTGFPYGDPENPAGVLVDLAPLIDPVADDPGNGIACKEEGNLSAGLEGYLPGDEEIL
jgi:hypothetical protein